MGVLVNDFLILRKEVFNQINFLEENIKKRTHQISCQKDKIKEQNIQISAQRDEVITKNKLIESQNKNMRHERY